MRFFTMSQTLTAVKWKISVHYCACYRDYSININLPLRKKENLRYTKSTYADKARRKNCKYKQKLMIFWLTVVTNIFNCWLTDNSKKETRGYSLIKKKTENKKQKTKQRNKDKKYKNKTQKYTHMHTKHSRNKWNTYSK